MFQSELLDTTPYWRPSLKATYVLVARELGEDAYVENKALWENPFSMLDEADLHEAWRAGYVAMCNAYGEDLLR